MWMWSAAHESHRQPGLLQLYHSVCTNVNQSQPVDKQQQDWAATSLNSAAEEVEGPGASLLPDKLIVRLLYK